MAIDSTLFACQIPAAAHTVGEVIPLGVIAGPANVRSGRGTAILKNIEVGALRITAGSQAGTVTAQWAIHVKNSDWIDDVVSFVASVQNTTALSPDSGLSQIGHDCNLTQNSGWQVYAECIVAGTDTITSSLFALVDIDYPQVSSVQDPSYAIGIPTSVRMDMTVNVAAKGALNTASWSSTSVDYFKAGYIYCLEKVEVFSSVESAGFIAFSNAAGMGGLQRIIPVTTSVGSLRYPVKYASSLQKGPMDVKIMMFSDTAAANTVVRMCHDYVKKK